MRSSSRIWQAETSAAGNRHAGIVIGARPSLRTTVFAPAAPAHPLGGSQLCSPPQQQRQQQPRLAAASLDDEAVAEEDAEACLEEFEGRRRTDRGYTPFEFIDFTDRALKHEVSVWVDRPVGDCYRTWANRLNWMQWFDMIDEMGFHEEEPGYVSMYLWYRWATTPFLELYVTLERTEEEENKHILEEPVEGMPLVAAVLFTAGRRLASEDDPDGPAVGDGGEDTGEGTMVTLRISYLLPRMLYEFAGQVAVYGDVDRKLQACMAKMKTFLEEADLEALERLREADAAYIKDGFEQQSQKKARINAALERRRAQGRAGPPEDEDEDDDDDGAAV